jgi:Zn-dependent metalloprotease
MATSEQQHLNVDLPSAMRPSRPWPQAHCCMVSPAILRNVAANTTDGRAAGLRDGVLQTISIDASIRVARAARLEATRPVRSERRAFRVRDTTGAALFGRLTPQGHDVTIYDAGRTETVPGKRVRGQNDAPLKDDDQVNEAFDGLNRTLTFYAEQYGRNSIDDQGAALDATVHFGRDYDNAFWDGERMVFGDGDGVIFKPFTGSLDVIAHELTHAVTENEAGLIYWQQPGALNESISDVFGSLVKQYKLNQTADQADWVLGADLLEPGIDGVGIRSMKAPGTAFDDPLLGKDDQPSHMDHFVRTLDDNGGVHTNSGIPNHAFYLAATAVGGPAWQKMGLVWYLTLCGPYLRSNSSFRQFARLTTAYAGAVFGRASDEQKALRSAWQEVGLDV